MLIFGPIRRLTLFWVITLGLSPAELAGSGTNLNKRVPGRTNSRATMSATAIERRRVEKRRLTGNVNTVRFLSGLVTDEMFWFGNASSGECVTVRTDETN